MLKWLNTRKATEVGAALAESFVLRAQPPKAKKRKHGAGSPGAELQKFFQKFLLTVDAEARPLKFNVLQRAKLANTFKWTLLEKGIDKRVVDELTQALVMRLTPAASASPKGAAKR
jgi:hypothetical protein